ncbi:hypothetical protein [Clostridium sp. ZS2-4]|uniref:hypothetical protein n=1 Tax=Clostridium sp. ZS2-4 TaxID=2987703 RepID=UPI00227BAEC6|nr:hypothetical protein [Clostridium sp. ZS2-4]MCY6354255.1 hypothetical protein [Clostridium sp. ZS2-4]
MKRNYKMKKTISMKRFISEFGENFSKHTKEKLLKLEVRCVLTRNEDNYRLDIKHVEHTQYDCNSGKYQKEYAYGQLVVIDETLYFSEICTESAEVMQSPIVNTIYTSLNSEDMISDLGINSKKIDDNNIDYVIDSILTVCPEVSEEYLAITQGMISRAENKK